MEKIYLTEGVLIYGGAEYVDPAIRLTNTSNRQMEVSEDNREWIHSCNIDVGIMGPLGFSGGEDGKTTYITGSGFCTDTDFEILALAWILEHNLVIL